MKNNALDNYLLLHEAYEGDGGFLDGSRLEQHGREAVEKYEKRKKLAYYLNYLKPCVDAHVSPIFKSLAVRDYKGTGAKAWEMFLNDVDFTGTHIKDLMKRAALISKLNGVAFIVMDREQEVQGETVLALEADRSNLPYSFVVSPKSVTEIVLDKFGRIVQFVYEEADPDNEFKNAIRTLTPNGWSLRNSKGEFSGEWNLGVTPVIPLFSKEHENSNPFPPSDFLSVAKTNLSIYNYSSWLSDILINQTFSVLIYPSTNEDDLVIGTSNALGYPAEASHEPTFIAPPADPATILANNIERLQQECYRMAGVVNVTGVRSQASGVAKAWDFEQTNQTLSSFADMVESAELKLAKLFMRWTGVEFEYACNYPSDFAIADVETELANAEVAKGLGFGDEFNVEVLKKILTSYLPELKDKNFDDLVESYKQEQAKAKLEGEQVASAEGNE